MKNKNAALAKPIFRDPPDGIEDDCSGFLIGGMAQTDELALARAFKQAADAAVSKALRMSDLSYELAYPALFLYRHTIELYLKLVVRPAKPNHSIGDLARQFQAVVRSRLKQELPGWVMDRLAEFDQIDPDGQRLRYDKDKKGEKIWLPGEYWVRFRHLRRIVTALVDGIERMYFANAGP
jgi:hypothetical protein